MKTWSIVATVLAVGLWAAGARAQGQKVIKHPSVKGEITKVDGATVSLQPVAKANATAKPAVVEVATTAATVVTINGETKAVSDLTVGQKAEITLSEDGKSAISIRVGERVKKPGEHETPKK